MSSSLPPALFRTATDRAAALVLLALCAVGAFLRVNGETSLPLGEVPGQRCVVVIHPGLPAPALSCSGSLRGLNLPKVCEATALPASLERCETVELGDADACPVLSVRSTPASTRLLCGRGVDLNADPPPDLEALPGIGPAKARAIAEDRAANGPFSSPLELERVPGIGRKTVEQLSPFLEPMPRTRGSP